MKTPEVPSSDYYASSYEVRTTAAAAGLAIFFLIITLAHAWKVIAKGDWPCLWIVIGGIFEFVGLVVRANCHNSSLDRTAFKIQAVFIFLAPIFFVTSLHQLLDRLIHSSGHKELSLLRSAWVSTLSFVGDFLSLVLQSVGIDHLMGAKSLHNASPSRSVILSGLSIQLACIGFSFLCLVVFQLRVNSPYLARTVDPSLHLKASLRWLDVCSFLLLIRTITRLFEFQGGFDTYFRTNDWPLYVTDLTMMACFMMFTWPWHSSGQAAFIDNNYPLMPRRRGL